MISHLDHELGRVVKTLEDKGIMDNTIIVFAGDNGLALGRHGLFGKQNCYEHSVRVPLIFAGPGIPEGRETNALAYLFDIFPTLCELTGTPVPESVEGKDLSGCMKNPEMSPRKSLYFAYTEYQRAVKLGNYKLIEYAVPDRDRQTQLFDLRNDPWELENLAGKPEFARQLETMREELFRLRDEWDDQKHPMGQAFWKRF